jgi:hypothetical protein
MNLINLLYYENNKMNIFKKLCTEIKKIYNKKEPVKQKNDPPKNNIDIKEIKVKNIILK